MLTELVRTTHLGCWSSICRFLVSPVPVVSVDYSDQISMEQAAVSAGLEVMALVFSVLALTNPPLKDITMTNGTIWPAQDCSDADSKSIKGLLLLDHIIGLCIYVSPDRFKTPSSHQS